MRWRRSALTAAAASSGMALRKPGRIYRGWLWQLLTATRNPLVILLIGLAIISFATGDARAGTVMSLMVTLGVSLRFVQEARADAAACQNDRRTAQRGERPSSYETHSG